MNVDETIERTQWDFFWVPDDVEIVDRPELLYTRSGGSGPPSIMLFDMNDDKKEEKTVAKSAGGYEISGDGKKICISRGGTVAIQNAAAGATAKNALTTGMNVVIVLDGSLSMRASSNHEKARREALSIADSHKLSSGIILIEAGRQPTGRRRPS